MEINHLENNLKIIVKKLVYVIYIIYICIVIKNKGYENNI